MLLGRYRHVELLHILFSMTSTEPYLLIEQCGSKYGRLIYVITEHIPASEGYPASTREIRCMDLGKTALGNWKAQQGGCTHIQFFNEINDLNGVPLCLFVSTRSRRCTNCNMEFSKHYLRQNLLMEVRGVPA
ncbi:hypothetical protein EI94DRAFT_20776 [Lactarius quietus]|nr:hypothetical protein EI94DRAFT_20776 [Lactarius quietus]